MTTPAGGFTDDIPVAWQEAAGDRTPVQVAYSTAADSEPALNAVPGQTPQPSTLNLASSTAFGFDVGPYDPTRDLILDPVVILYAGYIGGGWTDEGNGIAVDAAGSAYVTGATSSDSTTFPVAGRAGPDLQLQHRRLRGEGQPGRHGPGLRRLHRRRGRRAGAGIAVDAAGSAYVTGYTRSDQSTFPVARRAGPDLRRLPGRLRGEGQSGGHGAGLRRLHRRRGRRRGRRHRGGRRGQRLCHRRYLSDRVHLPGARRAGPHLQRQDGYEDAFVAKVNPAGTALVYAGYIGGAGDEAGARHRGGCRGQRLCDRRNRFRRVHLPGARSGPT